VIEVCGTLSDISVGENVVTALNLLLNAPVRELVERHGVRARLVSQALVASGLLGLVTNAVTGLLVPLPLVFLLQTFRIFDGHVQGIIHEAVKLNCDGKFLNLILAVSLCLALPLLHEICLFALVAVFALENVIVVFGPVLLRCFSFLHSNVGVLLDLVVLEVPVRDDVVLADGEQLDVLASDSFYWIGRRTLVRGGKVMFLHRFVAKNVPVNVCVFARAEVPRLLLGVVWPFF